jgi:hypothetical protein
LWLIYCACSWGLYSYSVICDWYTVHVAVVYTATVWFVLDWYTVHVAEVYTATVWFVLYWYTVHVAEVLYSYIVICVWLIYCACSWGLYSYSVICVGLIYCACSWGIYSYSVIYVGLIYCAFSWGLYSYSVVCVWYTLHVAEVYTDTVCFVFNILCLWLRFIQHHCNLCWTDKLFGFIAVMLKHKTFNSHIATVTEPIVTNWCLLEKFSLNNCHT